MEKIYITLISVHFENLILFAFFPNMIDLKLFHISIFLFYKRILSNFYVHVPHLLYLNNICIINTFVTFIFSTTLNFILSFGSFFLILELLKKILISSFTQLSFFPQCITLNILNIHLLLRTILFFKNYNVLKPFYVLLFVYIISRYFFFSVLFSLSCFHQFSFPKQICQQWVDNACLKIFDAI